MYIFTCVYTPVHVVRQHTPARHTNRSSGQIPALSLLKPVGKGATHSRPSYQRVFLSISHLHFYSINAAQNHWMRRSRVASPSTFC